MTTEATAPYRRSRAHESAPERSAHRPVSRGMEKHEQSCSSPWSAPRTPGWRLGRLACRRLWWWCRGAAGWCKQRRGHPGVRPVVGARTSGERASRADGRVRGGEPGHQGQAPQRPLRLDQGAGDRRSGGRHDVRRRGPRRRLGQRLRQAGRHRRPVGADGRARTTTRASCQPDQGRRQDLHDPGRQLRLPDVHQRRPAHAGRRRPSRPPPAPSSPPPPRRSARAGQRQGLGPATVPRSAQRHPERRHVVGLGVGRQHARRRPAGPDEPRGQGDGRVRQGPLGRRR